MGGKTDLLAATDQAGDQAGQQPDQPRIRKSERREQILLELKLRPHVGIGELARRFGVSRETVRRDFDALSNDGLISRAHGGASAAAPGQYPGFDERNRTLMRERERIGRAAASLVQPGDGVMIDAGSTTLQAARQLARLGTRCTVITNSLPVAMALGSGGGAEVIMAPGELNPDEAAVTGPDTVEFLRQYNANLCLIGAMGLDEKGFSETVRGFSSVKRAMLETCGAAHLLICHDKFDQKGLARVGALDALKSVVTDATPGPALNRALAAAGVRVMVPT